MKEQDIRDAAKIINSLISEGRQALLEKEYQTQLLCIVTKDILLQFT